jgi:hypothetical protein
LIYFKNHLLFKVLNAGEHLNLDGWIRPEQKGELLSEKGQMRAGLMRLTKELKDQITIYFFSICSSIDGANMTCSLSIPHSLQQSSTAPLV